MLAQLTEHNTAKTLLLVGVGAACVLAAAAGSVVSSSAAPALVGLALVPVVAAAVVRGPWVAVGLYVIIAPWIMHATEIELGAGVPNLNFERLGIYGVTALVMFGILAGKVDRLRLTRFDQSWLMLIAAMILSGVLMGLTPPQTVRQVVNENVYPFLIYFGMKHLVRTPEQVRSITISLVIAAVLLAGHAWVDQVLGLQIGKVDRAAITTHAQAAQIGGLHSLQLNRAAGPMGNSVTLGVSMIQGAVLGFFLLLTEGKRWIRVLGAAAIALCGVGMLVTYTRSVYFAFLLCAPLLWLWVPRLRKAILALGALGLFGLALYLPLAFSDPDNRILNLGSIFERFGMWATSFYFIKASPLVGHGYGFETYPHLKTLDLVPRLEFIGRRYYLSNTTPHNEFLRMLVTMGVVGLVLYCRYLWTMFSGLNRFRKRLPAMGLEAMRPYVVGAACGLVGFYGQCLFTDMTAMNYADTVVFLFFGAVMGVYENARLRSAPTAPEPAPEVPRVAPDPWNQPSASRTSFS